MQMDTRPDEYYQMEYPAIISITEIHCWTGKNARCNRGQNSAHPQNNETIIRQIQPGCAGGEVKPNCNEAHDTENQP